MNCPLCRTCSEVARAPGRCPYGGPFEAFVPSHPINEAAYIAGHYGACERLTSVCMVSCPEAMQRRLCASWRSVAGRSWQEVQAELTKR